MRYWCQLGFIFAPKNFQNRVLEASWTVLGASWGVLEASRAVLGWSWTPLGAVLGRLGASWRLLGRVLGQLELSCRRQMLPWAEKDAKGGAATATRKTRSGMRGAPKRQLGNLADLATRPITGLAV